MLKDSLISKDKIISRKEAAFKLGISLRTLDRYIDKKLLASKQESRNIFLYEAEIERLLQKIPKKNQESLSEDGKEEMPLDFQLNDEDFEKNNVTEIDDTKTTIIADSSIMNYDFKKEAAIYKELYFDIKNELREAQKRVENGNYRVGQLETQLKNTVPLLELSKKEREAEKLEKEFQEEKVRLASQLEQSKQIALKERNNKIIFLILLIFLLLIEPIIILIEFFSKEGIF